MVDEDNLLGELYGFKAIPNGLLIDEAGVLRHKIISAFDINLPDTADFLEQWLTSPSKDLERKEFVGEDVEEPGSSIALSHFRRGVALKRLDEAVAEWQKAVVLEPDNYLIRKQVWAAEHPEKFYSGDVDYDWQGEQLKAGL